MARSQSPNWAGPPPPPPRSFRTAAADWFARWGFALLTLFFLVLVGAAMFLLPAIRNSPGPVSDPTERPTVSAASANSTPPENPMYLSISSRPAGARVELDVDSIGTTPLYLLPVDRSVHLLSVELDGFRRIDTLLYDTNSDTASFFFVLMPDRAGSPVLAEATTQPAETTPPPAETTVTPDNNDAPDPSATERDQDNAQPAETTRSNESQPSEPRQPIERTPARPTSGSLTVTSEPLGAVVVVDGREVGVTPTSVTELQPGEHDISLQLDGFDQYATSVDVRAGQSSVVRATLVPSLGRLAVLVKPWGSIYVDGRLLRTNIDILVETAIPAGEHTVTASHPTLGRITRTVRVPPGRTHKIVFDLNDMNVVESQNN